MVATSAPSTRTRPESGAVSRLKQRRSVVLPEPLSPTSASDAPRGTLTVTPSRAITLPKRFETRSAPCATGRESLAMPGRSTPGNPHGSPAREKLHRREAETPRGGDAERRRRRDAETPRCRDAETQRRRDAETQ